MTDTTAEENKKHPRRFRFTLRTMFVVTAVVALCLGLLIHYGGCAGILLAISVVCFACDYFRGDKAGMVVCVILFATFWIALQFIGPYTSLRNRVVWIVGTERLQQWAVETLDNPPPPDEYGYLRLNTDEMPEDIRSIAGYRSLVVPARNGDEAYLLFGHGGGFYHWAILVGRPGFVPSWRDDCEKISDGIWGYYGE